jgi:acyl-CoA-binding protein
MGKVTAIGAKNLQTEHGEVNTPFLTRLSKFTYFRTNPCMELAELFEKAVAESKSLSEKPSNETLLQLYSLYKQATEGDNTSDPPANPFDFVSRAKYDAWSGQSGKTKAQAMEEYVSLVNKLKS